LEEYTEPGALHGHQYAIIPEWVLHHQALTDRAVRLFAVLARYANDEGRAFPGRRKLAGLLRCSVDTVDRTLTELVNACAVTVEAVHRPNGSQTSNSYWVWPATPAAAVRPPLGTGAAPQPQPCGPPSRTGAAPFISNESQLVTKTSGKRYTRESSSLFGSNEAETASVPTVGFDEFWEAYPRKVAKGSARRAWGAAARKAGAARLVEAAAAYAADPHRVARYTKHPASWLNGECWDDPPCEPPAEPAKKPAQRIDTDRGGKSGRIKL
jgi:hypothetical protein